jgi:hypothetical protein
MLVGPAPGTLYGALQERGRVADGNGDNRRFFRRRRRRREAEELFPGADDAHDEDWLVTMGEELSDGDDSLPASAAPQAKGSSAAVVNEVLKALSDDMAELENRLSGLEEALRISDRC